MTAEDIFKITMAMIDEMTTTGELDESTVAEYRAKTPYILTMLQNEIIGIENRYRKDDELVFPVPIEDLEQNVQISDIKANAMLTNGLAAQLMLHEDTNLASYFNQRYEEMKSIFLKPQPNDREKIKDVYDAGLNY